LTAARRRFDSTIRRFSPRGRGRFCRLTFSKSILSRSAAMCIRCTTALKILCLAIARFSACDRKSRTVTIRPLGRCRIVTELDTLFTF